MDDKQDTAQVFTIIRALAGRSVARGYNRLLETPDGGRMAYERMELADLLMDLPGLSRLADGSVGAAYGQFVATERLSPQELIRKSRRGFDSRRNDIPHPHAWFGRRVRDTHDIWHVLTGYGRDPLGEACLAAFSYAQTGGLGWALIAVGSAFKAAWRPEPVRKAILEGYVRGRNAAWLLGEDYVRLLGEPLVAARTRLRLAKPPRIYESIPPADRVGHTRPRGSLFGKPNHDEPARGQHNGSELARLAPAEALGAASTPPGA
ncbi:MAG TPA: Coq4 family protein [Caulobacteraceae bacterium]|nr:Coq4 family protein [Caulobacteraceae bacterium]